MPDVPEGAEVLLDVDPGIDDGYVAQEENIIAPISFENDEPEPMIAEQPKQTEHKIYIR